MVSNLLGAPLVRGVCDLYSATCGGVDINNIHAGAVPGDHTAACEGVDGARAINAFTRCRVIARYGTGVDIVDVDAATRRGIQVTNAPNEWCAEEVADHAVGLWLAAARKICQYDRAVRRGEWRWQTGDPIWRIRGRIFGLVSFGSIARSIAARVRPFGVDVWAYIHS